LKICSFFLCFRENRKKTT